MKVAEMRSEQIMQKLGKISRIEKLEQVNCTLLNDNAQNMVKRMKIWCAFAYIGKFSESETIDCELHEYVLNTSKEREPLLGLWNLYYDIRRQIKAKKQIEKQNLRGERKLQKYKKNNKEKIAATVQKLEWRAKKLVEESAVQAGKGKTSFAELGQIKTMEQCLEQARQEDRSLQSDSSEKSESNSSERERSQVGVATEKDEKSSELSRSQVVVAGEEEFVVEELYQQLKGQSKKSKLSRGNDSRTKQIANRIFHISGKRMNPYSLMSAVIARKDKITDVDPSTLAYPDILDEVEGWVDQVECDVKRGANDSIRAYLPEVVWEKGEAKKVHPKIPWSPPQGTEGERDTGSSDSEDQLEDIYEGLESLF